MFSETFSGVWGTVSLCQHLVEISKWTGSSVCALGVVGLCGGITQGHHIGLVS